jgi:hypothetical protein
MRYNREKIRARHALNFATSQPENSPARLRSFCEYLLKLTNITKQKTTHNDPSSVKPSTLPGIGPILAGRLPCVLIGRSRNSF